MKLHHLRDFLAVAECGSIHAAARHLGMSQPSLSRSIRDLEKELGVPLLDRGGRGAPLTAMGMLFARRANASVSELRKAREEILQAQGGVQGTVAACVSSLCHVALLPHALKPFSARYPRVALHIVEASYPAVEARLRSGAIDIYVGPEPAGSPAQELQLEKLFDTTRVVVSRKGHPLAKARSLAELVDCNWITTSITQRAEAELGELFISRGLPPPHLALRAETALTWITALTNTDVLSITPRQSADSPTFKPLVEVLNLRESLSGPTIVLIRRSAVPPTPAAEFLCDLLRRAAARYARMG